jgi:hypothetical protein
MAEAQNYIFTFKQIAEALVKEQGIHEGFWAIYVEFGIGAGHIPAGPNTDALMPAAVIPIVKMGIQRAEQPTPLTVDAAEVNPKKGQSVERRKRRRTTAHET